MRILPLFIPHAGCPHTCLFCNQKMTSLRNDKPDYVEAVRLIEAALSSGRIDEVAYYGGSFTALPDDVVDAYLGLVQPYIRRGEVGGIRLSTRPDAIDEALVDRLDAAGVTTIEIGCQSFSDEVLARTGRGHSAADSFRAAALIRESGIHLGIQLMPGLPGGDAAEAITSLERALELAPDFVRVYPALVLQETALAELWQNGGYEPFSLEEAVLLCTEIDLRCRAAGVPVIRYGLQANDELDSGAVLAGPYHPAFGQLVRSRLWLAALAGLKCKDAGQVMVHPAELSDAFGQRKMNLEYLNRDGAFAIVPDNSVPRGWLEAGSLSGSLYELAGPNFERIV